MGEEGAPGSSGEAAGYLPVRCLGKLKTECCETTVGAPAPKGWTALQVGNPKELPHFAHLCYGIS